MTPAALIACRSIGASSQGRSESRDFGRRVGEDLLERAQTLALGRAQGAAASGASQRSREVAKAALTSKTPSARKATTDGPSTSGRQTRPARAPA